MEWHPFAAKFPLLEGEEWKAFKESIRKTKGNEVPVVYRLVEGNKQGIDGRNRERACLELKLECNYEKRFFDDEAKIRDYIIRRNVHRRHMSKELRQEIVGELRADGQSTRQIAEKLGVSQSTIANDLNSTEQNCSVETVVGKDGKKRKAKARVKPKTLSEAADAALAEQESEQPEPTIEEKIKAKNAEFDGFCRELMKLADAMPDDPWLQFQNRRGGAIQKLRDCCETIRSAKCHSACPKCAGDGCKVCHETGRITKAALDQL
jgi:transposase